MVWKVISVNDDGFLQIEVRDKADDKDPAYVHNMKPTSVDKTEAQKEIQGQVDAIWEKIQKAKAESESQKAISNLIGLNG